MKRDLTCFSKLQFFIFYSRSLKCPPHIDSYTLRIGLVAIHFNASVIFLSLVLEILQLWH